MFARLRRRYARFERVLVGADFHSEGGSWRSLHRYYVETRMQGRELLLLDRRNPRGLRQVLAAALLAPRGRIVVNSLNSLAHLDVLLLLLLRPDAALYLHETAWMLDSYRRERPLGYRLLRRVLRRNPLLCVSTATADYYRGAHGARRVVGEGVDEPAAPVLEPGFEHVVMVGSLCARKGVGLFGEAARLAAVQMPALRFHWVGGPPGGEALEYVPEVTWWGWRGHPAGIVAQARVFLLASRDDPQPLAALEALRAGVPVVCYCGTGTAEIVAGLPGCGVCTDYTPEACLAALRTALAAAPDPAALRARALRASGVVQFTRRLEDALDA